MQHTSSTEVCVFMQQQNNLCAQHQQHSSSIEVCVRFPQWPPGGAHPVFPQCRSAAGLVCDSSHSTSQPPLTELSALPTWLDNSWLEGEGREVREETKGQQQEREQARGGGGGGGGGFG